MKSNYFIVSKPLRYLNIKNIPGFEQIPSKRLIIVDQFNKADEFYKNVCLYENCWEKVYFVSSVNKVYLLLLFKRIKALYIFVDCSIIIGILYFIHRMEVVLLEEGIGTYFPEVFKAPKQRTFIRKLLHVGDVLGSSDFTSKIYVYFPKVFLSNTIVKCDVCSFEENMLQFIVQNKEEFLKLFSCEYYKELPFGSKVLLYITEWNIDSKILKFIEEHSNEFDYVWIKPHPHNKHVSAKIPSSVTILGGNIMAEFLISELISRGNEVTICHCGSTSVIYFMDKIKSILFESVDSANFEWQSKYNTLVHEISLN